MDKRSATMRIIRRLCMLGPKPCTIIEKSSVRINPVLSWKKSPVMIVPLLYYHGKEFC